jgi:hypothetical protein
VKATRILDELRRRWLIDVGGSFLRALALAVLPTSEFRIGPRGRPEA